MSGSPVLPAPRPGHPARPGRADFRALLRLALPIILVQLGMMVMGAVHTVMVGHVSAAALAAAALGNLYVFTVCSFGMGVLMALDPLISQAHGAGDRADVARGLQRGTVLALGLALVSTLALLPTRRALPALGQPAEVVPLAAGYVDASLPGVLPFYAFLVLRQTLQAMHRTRPIVITILAANLVNAAAGWLFIFGGPGVPAMGAVGAGIAATVARWFMALGVLVVGWRDLAPYLRPWRRDALDPRALGQVLAIGAPIGVQLLLEFGVFSIVGLLMGRLGTAPMAAHQVAINIASVTYMIPLGVSSAAAVLVGQAIGAADADRARRAAGAAMILGVGFMCCSGATLALLPRLLARVYTADPAVLDIAVVLVALAALFQVFDGTQVVAIGVLRGSGDTRIPMIANLIGYWLLGLPVSVWLGFGLGGGAAGLWWGLVAGLAGVALYLLQRTAARLRGGLARLRVDPETAAAG